MPRRKSETPRLEISALVLAIAVLFGVLIMAFGFYHYDSLIIYTGVLVTGAASWMTLVLTLTKIRR